MTPEVEIRGVVLAVTYADNEGNLKIPESEDVFEQFIERGFDVQAVRGPEIDGAYLVEVRS